TRSTSTRPYHLRSKTAIPPHPGRAAQKRQTKWLRRSSSVGAANWAPRTSRESSGATSRLIAPPLTDAPQPSHATSSARPGPAAPVHEQAADGGPRLGEPAPGAAQLLLLVVAVEAKREADLVEPRHWPILRA